jgi:hypothetical protein
MELEYREILMKRGKMDALCRAAHEYICKSDQRIAELEVALTAIKARIGGEFDNPALVAYGPLLNTTADVLHIIEKSLDGKDDGG